MGHFVIAAKAGIQAASTGGRDYWISRLRGNDGGGWERIGA
jgi:hypothetical protein